jgi:hypothetical protein
MSAVAYYWPDARGGVPRVYCPDCYDLDMCGIDAEELDDALGEAGQDAVCCDCGGPLEVGE